MSTVAKKIMMGSGATASAYEIDQSLIFDRGDGSYLHRTPSSAGNRRTWTWSAWVKRCSFTGSASSSHALFGAHDNSTSSDAVWCVIQLYQDKLILNGWNTNWRRTSRLFRDASAWYHIVVAVDTTQGTADNRVKFYINGVQETSFEATSNPDQNYELGINSTIDHRVGNINYTSTYVPNALIAEVHFIDGTALAPSSFGETNSATGQWIPKQYTGGSYGTNGFYLPFKEGGQSIFFDGTDDDLKTAANQSAFNFGTGDFTIELFFKRTNTDLTNDYAFIMDLGENGASIYIYDGNQRLRFTNQGDSGGIANVDMGQAVAGAWHHVAISRVSGTTSGYLNGTRVFNLSDSKNYPADHLTVADYGDPSAGPYYGGPMYVSNLRIIKGSGIYSGTSITVPTSKLTNVTNTSFLGLQGLGTSATDVTVGPALTATSSPFPVSNRPSSFTSLLGVGTDHSGQGNDYTPANLSNSDVVTDTPTDNFCTLNSLSNYNATLTQGNLVAAQAGHSDTTGTFQIPFTGKWYFECVATTAGAAQLGIAKTSYTVSAGSWVAGKVINLIFSNGNAGYNAGGEVSYIGSAISNGNTVGVAIDSDNGKIYFAKNNTWGNSGNPLNGTNPAATFTASDGWRPLIYGPSGTVQTFNFGQKDFAYTPPSGFSALSTANLPDPAIAIPSAHLNTVTYSGNSSSQAITVGFQPDFVWLKRRNLGKSHYLSDSVRGAHKVLFSESSAAEYDATSNNDGVDSFDSNGFTLQNGTYVADYNVSGGTYVSWNWKANGSGSSNSDGAISSTVSANQTAGFSIVTFTMPGSGTTTIGHGLGAVPDLIFAKSRGSAAGWITWDKSLTNSQALQLNDSAAIVSSTNIWGAAIPTSSVFGAIVGGVAPASTTAVAYCFASKNGYSSIGTYTGNGSADGPMIVTGFRPALVITKRTDATGYWGIFDAARAPGNVAAFPALFPNVGDAEATNTYLDLLSNGFKIRITSTHYNASGGTYLYMAFAESPFKTANAR